MSAGIQDIASDIRRVRKAKALTQAQLGQRVGLPQSHISKIEKGVVDLQLSSLAEIARALDLEVKLIPRQALPAVEGAVRTAGASAATSRALATLNDQARLAERIKIDYPDLSQVEAFQNAVKNIPAVQFDAAKLKALNEALQPTRRLQKLLEDQGGTAALAKHLERATAGLQQFRNVQVHAPFAQPRRQLPAHRLEQDEA